MTTHEFMAFQAACKSLEVQLIKRGSHAILINFTRATQGLLVEQDKVFIIDGSPHMFDYALRIGTVDGPIWACTNGDVVHAIPSDTPSAELLYSASETTAKLLPSGFWPDEVSARLHTPLDADIKALVRWIVACWAMRSDPGASGAIQLPKLETLDAALQWFVVPEQSDQDETDHSSLQASSETSDGEHGFASTSYLRGKLGREAMRVLPKLEALSFFPQDDEDFHRISLNIGACADETSGTVHGVYVWVQRHSNFRNSPPITLVVGPEIEVSDDLGKPMSEDNPGLRLNITDFFSRFKPDCMYLHWPFRVAGLRLEERRALFKYCFILAAESRVFGYKNHRIPPNNEFETQLQAVCDLIRSALKKGDSTGPSKNFIKMLQRRLRILAGANTGRTTRTAGDAEDDALQTGLMELDDVPRQILDGLEGESNHASESMEEPPELDLPFRSKRRSRGPTRRSISFEEGDTGTGHVSSPGHAHTLSSRRSSPVGKMEQDQTPFPDLAHAPTPHQQSLTSAGKVKAEGSDLDSSMDSESAPSRHSVHAATPAPPNFTPTFRAVLPLRNRPPALDLETNLKYDLHQLKEYKNALRQTQPRNLQDKANIEASLATIDEERMKIRQALASIDKESDKIREVLNKSKKDEQQDAKIQEALDLVREAATPLEDLKMKLPPADWEKDVEMMD